VESSAPGYERFQRVGGRSRVLSVSDLTRSIRELLELSFGHLLVRGQITNLSRPQSGHLYFSLVDDVEARAGSRLTSAQLSCVLWRSSVARLRFQPQNGQKVIASGRIGVYEPRGAYQLVAEALEPAGLGELQLLFEALKERLRTEGLFDPERKRRLPFLPRRIGIITSPTGAAIQDILRVLYLRHPKAWVRLVPVRVQGDGAAEEISQAIEIFQRNGGQADVLVLARGGGSLEDLWAFNDERVARALAASSIPTISAVGHEVDFSISDFVADVRAQTPTQAAELLVPDFRDLLERLQAARRHVRFYFEALHGRKRAELIRLLRARPLREPAALTQELFERCDLRGKELRNHLYNRKRQWEDAAGSVFGRLESLNPLRVLARGYSVTTDSEGRVVSDVKSLTLGENLRIQLFQGGFGAKVVEIEQCIEADRRGSAIGEGTKRAAGAGSLKEDDGP